MRHIRRISPATLVLMTLVLSAACDFRGPASTRVAGPAALDWTPDAGPAADDLDARDAPDGGRRSAVTARSAATKAKNLLVGLPATDAEAAAVARDPATLRGLVRSWMRLPGYEEKMRRFFMTAFQQDQVTLPEFIPQYDNDIPFNQNSRQILENFQESFARTTLQLISEGRPFTETLTTRRFMMTPALMASYAVLDSVHVDDKAVSTDLFKTGSPTGLILQSSRKIPIEQAVDVASPDYMTFFDPGFGEPPDPDCPRTNRQVYPSPISTYDLVLFLFDHGPGPQYKSPAKPGHACFLRHDAGYVLDTDFTAWRMITIRPPKEGESPTRFFDLPKLRVASELISVIPRMGFFSTPAFLARWATNQSNQARVTLNQTLVTALGAPVDYTNTTEPAGIEAVDQKHAVPGGDCYACHESLDPMRQIFRRTYSLNFSPQTDASQLAVPGHFAFQGVKKANAGILDLGELLAGHPLFAAAWVQKLCTYATSSPCDPKDPEFVRLVKEFVDSGYSWNALVEQLFSSPLVTYLRTPMGTGFAHPTFPISRQSHLCATLSARLGVPDVCSLNAGSPVVSPAAKTVAATWPSDQYGRGNPVPVMANAPSLFLRGGLENICASLATLLVQGGETISWGGPARPYSTSDVPAAIQSLAANLMGLSGRKGVEAQKILLRHFNSAREERVSDADALRSTFVLACLSPTIAGVGQ